jgi:hypothetical protein
MIPEKPATDLPLYLCIPLFLDTAMVTPSLRPEIIDEAKKDAGAFFREFQHAVTNDQADLDWVAEAWADIRHDFDLDRDEADRLWPAYWKAFSEETLRLASIRVVGE